MKKLLFFIFLLSLAFNFNGYSQRRLDGGSNIMVSVGVNALANFGTRDPFKDIKDLSFRYPIAAAIEFGLPWDESLYIEQDVSLNGFTESTFIDNGYLTEDRLYLTTNTNFKWYYSDFIFKREPDWLDLYVATGPGMFNIDEVNFSWNASLGGTIWVSDNIGIRGQATAKFAFHAPDRQYDNNHYQYFLMGVFKL